MTEESREKRGFEGEYPRAVGAGSLRKEAQVMPGAQPRLKKVLLQPCIARVMNTVPVARASQPIPAQPATSDFATK